MHSCGNQECRDIVERLQNTIGRQEKIIAVLNNQVFQLEKELSNPKRKKNLHRICHSNISDIKLNVNLMKKIIKENGICGFISTEELITVLKEKYKFEGSIKKSLKKFMVKFSKKFNDTSNPLINCCGYLFVRKKLGETRPVSNEDVNLISGLINRFGVVKKSRSEFSPQGERIFRKLLNIALLDRLLFFMHDITPCMKFEKTEESDRPHARKSRAVFPELTEILEKNDMFQIEIDSNWVYLSNEEDQEGVHTIKFPKGQERPDIEGLSVEIIEEVIEKKGEFNFIRFEMLLKTLTRICHLKEPERDIKRYIADGRYEGPYYFSSYVFLPRSLEMDNMMKEVEENDIQKIIEVLKRYGLRTARFENSNKPPPLSMGIRLMDHLLLYIHNIKPRVTNIVNPPVPYFNQKLAMLVNKRGKDLVGYHKESRRFFLKKDEKVEEEEDGEEEEEEDITTSTIIQEDRERIIHVSGVDVTDFGFGCDFSPIEENGDV